MCSQVVGCDTACCSASNDDVVIFFARHLPSPKKGLETKATTDPNHSGIGSILKGIETRIDDMLNTKNHDPPGTNFCCIHQLQGSFATGNLRNCRVNSYRVPRQFTDTAAQFGMSYTDAN